MSTEPASPADESLAIYDAVQPANQPATASSGPAPASRQALASERSLTDKPPSMGVTMGLLAVLVVASLVLLVAALALWARLPFLAVVVLGAAAAALLRWLGWG